MFLYAYWNILLLLKNYLFISCVRFLILLVLFFVLISRNYLLFCILTLSYCVYMLHIVSPISQYCLWYLSLYRNVWVVYLFCSQICLIFSVIVSGGFIMIFLTSFIKITNTVKEFPTFSFSILQFSLFRLLIHLEFFLESGIRQHIGYA